MSAKAVTVAEKPAEIPVPEKPAETPEMGAQAPTQSPEITEKPEPPFAATAPGGEKPFVALILQGGGALGAYHVGAVQALEEAGLSPDWVAGISIGAFNSAIIAGNPPGRRLEKLTEFWEIITRPDFGTAWLHNLNPKLYNTMSYWESINYGQPRFFSPRYTSPYFVPQGTPAAVSYYDTSPMKATFETVTDYELINAGTTRLSLGTTDVESGQLVFFSNHDSRDNDGKLVPKTAITPEHVMASGSLPPGFPPQIIGDRQYWDGACVSNTPLQAFYNDQPRDRRCIVIVVDLWSADGPAPKTIDDVTLRTKQIQYATRTDANIDKLSAKMHLRSLLENSATNGASAAASLPEIYHIIYHPAAEQVSSSDVEFSRFSIQERREAGFTDMKQILPHAAPRPMLFRAEAAVQTAGVLIHRMESGGPIQTRSSADLVRHSL